MGAMKDFDIRIRNGGNDAIAAVSELFGDEGKLLKLVLAIAESLPQWIPVSERLPEEGVDVLAWLPCDERAYCGHITDDGFWESQDPRLDAYRTHGDPEGPTHWMPLPEPPPQAQ